MSRLALPPLLLAAVALLPVTARAAGPWSLHKRARGIRAIADGRAETPAGTVPALLRVHCHTKSGESLCVSLKVEEADRTAGFPFAAFLEPGGAARGQPLLRAHAGELGVDVAVEGEWTREPPGSFAFTFCGPADDEGEAAALARAIAAGTGEVELVVRQPAGAAGEIRARFPADSEDHAVREVLRRCSAR